MEIMIHSNYSPDNPGGIEAVVSQLIETLGDQGYKILCFCGDEHSSGQAIHKGQRVIYRKVIAKFAGAPLLSFGNLLFLWNSRKTGLIIFQEPFPLLWPAAFVLRWIYRVPLIVLVHANPVAPRFVMSIYSFLRKIVFRGAICVSTSPNLLSKVQASGYVDSKFIPLCIPEKPLPSTYVLELPKRFALYFGRLAGYKGIPYLLDAAIDSPEVSYVIAGAGPLSNTVTKYISDGSMRNILLINRFISEEEKLELISRCEFLVFPSTTQNEAFGLVQLEAMRYGKAIINTLIDSGVNFVAPHGDCALTVDPSDSIALSAAVKRLWDDHDLVTSLGNSGRKRFLELFSEDKFRSAWKNIIKGYVASD